MDIKTWDLVEACLDHKEDPEPKREEPDVFHRGLAAFAGNSRIFGGMFLGISLPIISAGTLSWLINGE